MEANTTISNTDHDGPDGSDHEPETLSDSSPEVPPQITDPNAAGIGGEDTVDDVRPLKRRKITNDDKEEDEIRDENEGQICSICLEGWSNSGNHRIASLKCGHLFGLICIEKWLKGAGGNKCPQCNSTAKKQDIRVIYTKSISAIDTTDKDRALKELEEEKLVRIACQKSEAQTLIQYQVVKAECEKLKQELKSVKEQLEYYTKFNGTGPSVATTSHSTKDGGSFVPFKHIPISSQGDCRVIDQDVDNGIIVVSRPSDNSLFPGWGLTKISMANFKSKEFFKIHDKCIRDVQFSPRGDGIVVTTGLDKTLQLSSIHSNVLVHKYSLPVPGWSCCWNYDQPTYIYCGLANGSIMIFDTRRTDCHVKELKRNDSLVPVTSLAYVPVCHASDLFCSGVLAGTLDGCVIWEKSHDTYKPHLLNTLSGSCTSVSFESTTRHCLASFRPSKRNPTSRHIVSQLKNNPAEGTIISNPLNHFKGSSTCSVLSRSTLFLQPNTTNQLRVAYSNESTKKICICDVSVDSTIQQLSTNNEPSLDTSIIDCGDRGTLLASLTQHNLYLFNWKI